MDEVILLFTPQGIADHTQNHSVKGINILNCLHHAGGVALPVAFKLVRNPFLYSDLATKKVKRKSEGDQERDAAAHAQDLPSEPAELYCQDELCRESV